VVDEKKRRKRTKSGSSQAKRPSRYTPPVPVSVKHSSRWVPIFMFGFFIIGVAMILLNYLPGAPLLPGDTSNWYLLGGLGAILLGFVAATRYR